MKARKVLEALEDVLLPKSSEDIGRETFDLIKKYYYIANGIGKIPGEGSHNYEDINGDEIIDDEERKAIDAIMYFYNVEWRDSNKHWESLGLEWIPRILSKWDSGDGSDAKEFLSEINDEIEPLYDELSQLFERGGGGAGYAVWGGGWGRNFGNPSQGRSFGGRGFGFGQSSSSGGGPNIMYTYSIKPLNQILEPDPTYADVIDKIYPGVVIKAKLFNKDKYIIGQVQSVQEDGDGNISSYTIMDPDRAQPVKVDPTSAFVWNPEPEGIDYVTHDLPGVKNESYKAKSVIKK